MRPRGEWITPENIPKAARVVSSEIKKGASFPLGATPSFAGVNFSVFSKNAIGLDLLLFDSVDDLPAREIHLDASANRTYHYWHVFVTGLKPGQIYGYRVHGPFDPANGMRFDSSKLLLDPYGRGVVVPTQYSRDAARTEGDNTATAMKSVVVDSSTYDWEDDAPLKRPSARTIVYEMHVGGFTRHPSSGVAIKSRGTFAGMIEKTSYLKELGVTAVELLPVFQFDAQDCPPGLVNYWGYQPVSYFAPTRLTVRVRILSARCTSFAIWSRRYTAPALRSFWMWSSITPPKATIKAPRLVFADLTTVSTTSSRRTARAIPITAGRGTRSTLIIQSSGG